MLLISSYMLRGHRWQLAALVALFFVAGCTVEFYPPVQEVSNLPDGGKVDVLPDTIPAAYAFGPRIFWSQIVASDSAYSIAVTDANNKGRWLDSLRWVPSGPFVTVNGDTLSTRAYARENSGVTGDNQVLTYNGSGSLTIEDGNTVDMSDLLDNTDAQTIDTISLSGTTLSLSLESDGEAAQTVDLSALAVIDSTRLTQDSILVYYQDGAEVGRDTIAGTGGGGGVADNLGNHIMTQNLQTNSNWISGDGGNEGISVDAAGKAGIGTLTPSYALDINSTDAVRLPVGTTAQNPTGADGLLRYNSDSTALTGYYNAQWNRLVDHDYLSSTAGQAASNYWVKSGNLLRWASGGLELGTTTITPTATPLNVSFGGTFGTSTPGSAANLKWDMFDGGPDIYRYGIGMSINLMEFRGGINAGFGFFPNASTSIALKISKDRQLGIQTNTPTAALHLPAGTSSANTAPLKFTSGTNLATPEAGAVEWDGTNLYITQASGPTRKTIAYVDTDAGSASDTTDGSGDITVSHTLGSASITVNATTTGTTFYHVQVHTKTSTTFKIRFFDATGAAVIATAVTADWIAKLQ